MTARYPLPISFKASREYLRGIDLYAEIHRALALHVGRVEFTDIHFKIPKFYRTSLAVEISPAQNRPAEWICAAGGQSWQARLIEESAVPPREPYDETFLNINSAVTAERAHFTAAIEVRAIEAAVFLTKILHNQLFPPGAGLWAFSRLDLPRSLPIENLDGRRVRIELGSKLGDFFTRSQIFLDEKPAGSIFFSKVAGV